MLLDSEQPPPDDVVRLVMQHKPNIIKLLHSKATAWNAEDWKAYYDERAAIYEFDACIPRPDAELRASRDCIVEWQKHHPVHSAPGWCLVCGGADAVALFAGETGNSVWLHATCAPDWWQARRGEAEAALRLLGIALPSTPSTCDSHTPQDVHRDDLSDST